MTQIRELRKYLPSAATMRSFLLSQQQQAFRLIWITDVYRQDVSGQKLASYGFRKKNFTENTSLWNP